MYWYKRYVSAIIGLSVLCFASCKSDGGAAKDTMKFFDLKGYFATEAARLNKLNPSVDKTAIFNNQTEEKKIHISNWASELSMFSESDINKPAWRSNYTIQSNDSLTIYKANDTTLKTQNVTIKRVGNKIVWIFIYNHIHRTMFNANLYESKENLMYSPDSYYRVKRRQSTRVLGIKTFDVIGRLN